MIAAGTAANKGYSVTLIEKNNRLGKKLYITGKGRCNLTNSGDIQNFIDNIKSNPFFLYSSLYNFDNQSTIEFFQKLGVNTKVERGGRVFPNSDKAEDIVRALERFLNKASVKVYYNEKVENLIIENNKIKGISTQTKNLYCDRVIIATGGLSYPSTGSTGDGYKLAKSAGHTVTKLYPSLVPLTVSEVWCSELQGLSLKNISIVAKNNHNETLYKGFGELMFTHYGLSGPLILSASRDIVPNINDNIIVTIDLKPALDNKSLDNRILRDFKEFKNKEFKNSLNDLLPQKLIPVIIMLSNIPEYKKVNEITKEERLKLCYIIKNFSVHINGFRSYNEAVITMGGINTTEIEPSTMESKLIDGLFFAGEIIDVDAYTGGYNLQIAFSTGYTAGISV